MNMRTELVLENIVAGKNEVKFISTTMGGELKLAGLLFTPVDFDSSKQYPTVVLTGAFNQVKEQTCSIYAQKLAEQGYIALCFDHQGYGESEGYIRNYEYAPAKIEGIHDAISFLCMQKFVDTENLFGIGICAGASHMAYTALTDKRLKKIALVGGMLVNTVVHFTANGKKKSQQMLEAASQARQKAYETGDVIAFDALGMDDGTAKNSKITDQKEGYDYYMTERAGAQTYPTYSHKTPEFFVLDFPRHSARAIARFLTTPTITIHGSKASTKIFSCLFHWAKKGPKKRVSIKGATHVDLYDKDQYVGQAIKAAADYFQA
ncbi:alpha/beta hydrolase [Vibrio rotiferianus]|uniref:alpha/beta hydrolase n=1 Tax=Vibrio rotiferianus TaxID=190895 RepID=UPI00148B5957|nr:alpha/beta hydrolase [Vibrio rotiferianus]NOH69069.1 alpha/beta hydrolase [Vibrio rotiferianus]